MKAFAVLLALLIATPVMAAEQPVTTITIKGKKQVKKPMSDAEIKRQLDDLANGSIVSIGEVTLGNDPATTTTVTHRLVSENSIVLLMPANAAARNQISASGDMVEPYISTVSKGSFVITHLSSTYGGTPYVDRRYRYVFFTPRKPLN